MNVSIFCPQFANFSETRLKTFHLIQKSKCLLNLFFNLTNVCHCFKSGPKQLSVECSKLNHLLQASVAKGH